MQLIGRKTGSAFERHNIHVTWRLAGGGKNAGRRRPASVRPEARRLRLRKVKELKMAALIARKDPDGQSFLHVAERMMCSLNPGHVLFDGHQSKYP